MSRVHDALRRAEKTAEAAPPVVHSNVETRTPAASIETGANLGGLLELVEEVPFRAATDSLPQLTRHAANSAATLRLPESHFDAVRCGIALYGISPFGGDPAGDGLEPVLSWTTELAQVKLLRAGESTGYGRRFVAHRDTWVGILPVGYADGLRRSLTGTSVLVAGEPRPVIGAISMDAAAVLLDRALPAGTTVTIVGNGQTLEAHAEVAGTIAYELACGIASSPTRARRVVKGS